MIEGALARLAKRYGVELAYDDVRGVRHEASPQSVIATLRALGHEVDEDEAAVAEAARSLPSRPLPPTVVAWDGALALPSTLDPSAIELLDEEGAPCTLSGRLAAGYYTLRVRTETELQTTTVIAAPRRAYGLSPGQPRPWGVFAPTYALHDEHSLGVGDLGTLERLLVEVRRRGGQVVGTLPLFAAFLTDHPEPSPYRPVSRRFFNELYLDIRALPDLEACPAARALLASDALRHAVSVMAPDHYVDPPLAMQLKRPILERLAEAAHTLDPAALEDDSAVGRYARFRAVGEATKTPFHAWPERLRRGDIRSDDYDPRAYRYHVYVQRALRAQLTGLDRRAREGGGLGLYLDMPIGVHPDGFDAFDEPSLFARGLEVGAPPDAFFTQGQRWGFSPLCPRALVESGLGYVRACLAAQMACAGMLRIDHVMSMHRLFVIPDGMDAQEGVYLRYPVDAHYAVLALESQRHQTLVVGEDLGTVPPEVRTEMAAHGVLRMYVFSSGASASGFQGHSLSDEPPPESVASVNTHDMGLFAAFVRGQDIALNVERGNFTEEEGREASARRRDLLARLTEAVAPDAVGPLDPALLLQRVLEALGASRAEVVIATLEDLLLEERPQNVPGTGPSWRNFRRKLACSLPELFARADFAEGLGALDRGRRLAPRSM